MLARFHPSPAMVVALAALIVALGGSAYAVTSFVGSNGRIHGCVSKKGKLVLVKPGAKCKKGLSAIAWNKNGPRGKQGLKGNAGPSGPPAASMANARTTLPTAPPTNDRYAAISGVTNAVLSEASVDMLSPPIAVVARDLSATFITPPGGPNFRYASLVVNGSSTKLQCYVENVTKTCSDTSDAVAIPPSSTLALRFQTEVNVGTVPPTVALVTWRATVP